MSRENSRFMVIVLVGALAALTAFWTIDLPVARWSIESSYARFLHSPLDVCEFFGDGFAVVLIAATVWTLDLAHRRAIPWLFAGAWGGGMVANLIKLSIGRMRPRAWLEHAEQATHGPMDTFTVWLPIGTGGSGHQSFPSGHTATAFGLAVILATLYPQGRAWFYVLATLVAAQRVASHAHFVSDVILGGLIGWAVAMLISRRMAKAESGKPKAEG